MVCKESKRWPAHGTFCHYVNEVITICLALCFSSKDRTQLHLINDLPDDIVRCEDSEVQQLLQHRTCCEGSCTQVTRVVCPVTDDHTQLGSLGAMEYRKDSRRNMCPHNYDAESQSGTNRRI